MASAMSATTAGDVSSSVPVKDFNTNEDFLIATDIISNHPTIANNRLLVSPSIEAAASLLENSGVLPAYCQQIDFMKSFSWFQIEKNECHYMGLVDSETVWFQRSEGNICSVPFVLKLLLRKKNEITRICELKLQVEDPNLPSHIKAWVGAGESQNSLKELFSGLYSFYCNAEKMEVVTGQLENHDNIRVDSSKPYSRKISILCGSNEAFIFNWKIKPSEANMSMEHAIRCSKSEALTPQILSELKKIGSLDSVSELTPLFLEIARLLND